MSSPPSLYKRWSLVLNEVKQLASSPKLRHIEAIRVTSLTGQVTLEEAPPRQEPVDEAAAASAAAAAAAAPQRPSRPSRVAPGLYLGGAAAARNLKALRKCGVTHIVNASPSVPCHFRDNPPGGAFVYLALQLFDDPEADLMAHVPASNAFIDGALRGGGAVLVHCFAGQSRSAALVMAYLMEAAGRSMMQAWDAARAARPCAHPNPGFLRQLALYSKSLNIPAHNVEEVPEEEVEEGAAAAAVAADEPLPALSRLMLQ